jgi:NAD(P)-dependent dehydrogenase (short-subunit alcohol dehydrogenase family)
MRPFDNRRVLVTRSDRGIGKGSRSVLKAARRFCSSPGAATNSTRCALLELTSEARAVALDLTLLDSARQVVTATADAWDGLDIVAQTAGLLRKAASWNWTILSGQPYSA